jgi:hypothetical protein
MTDQTEKQQEYGEYAEHCLHTVRMMPNREARDSNGEWRPNGSTLRMPC